MSPRERRIERDGARLRLVEAGEGAAVLFQHGLGGDAAQAEGNFPDAAGWHRLTLECRAQGQSEPGATRPFGIAMFADDCLSAIEATTEAAGARSFVAGGVSMGAAIALRLAVTRSDLVRALVLVRPAWIAEPAPVNMRPYAVAAGAMRAHPGDRDAARAAFAASPEARRLAEVSPDNLASLAGFFDRPDLASTADLLDGVAADGPGVTRAEIAALRLPVLVVGNGEDDVHPLDLARELSGLVPGAAFVEVPPKAADKGVHQAAVRRAIADFLAALPPSSSFEGSPR
ncbi:MULTISPECIES: alpha/beta fold hydrolase [unclassified Aureimonas]|uniref:alpha/beta fold hydrolase n=1 Tax=unclassified Aureimonas TaxID=2615206 RepID=UPI0006F91CEF|nr:MULTISPECIES: alpha/beta hydrolase [unclassified Aureimonas]KQT69836.1 esterase [Aureimonas sp. Leaf427]KQT76012.1 esterase [Aureimonas sp. Leaf460]